MRQDELVARFLAPVRIASRAEVLGTACPVPAVGGVYGWWFRRSPSNGIDISECRQRQGLILLYVGISPRLPAANGRPPSRSTLRTRIRTHYAGNAEGSTLRRTLGCLLAEELGLELRRVGGGRRLTFVEGEPRLSAWMAESAFVSWMAHETPWDLEDALIRALDLPLNLDGNERHPFHPILTSFRARATRRARELPVLDDPGIGGGVGAPLPALEKPVGGRLAPDMAGVLGTLVGRRIPTLSGRINRILEVRDGTVWVATDRSPDGKPVPIAGVQAAADRLYGAGEVDINVATVGYRSAFVGAVLATLPGTEVRLRPQRIVVASPGRARP